MRVPGAGSWDKEGGPGVASREVPGLRASGSGQPQAPSCWREGEKRGASPEPGPPRGPLLASPAWAPSWAGYGSDRGQSEGFQRVPPAHGEARSPNRAEKVNIHPRKAFCVMTEGTGASLGRGKGSTMVPAPHPRGQGGPGPTPGLPHLTLRVGPEGPLITRPGDSDAR